MRYCNQKAVTFYHSHLFYNISIAHQLDLLIDYSLCTLCLGFMSPVTSVISNLLSTSTPAVLDTVTLMCDCEFWNFLVWLRLHTCVFWLDANKDVFVICFSHPFPVPQSVDGAGSQPTEQ